MGGGGHLPDLPGSVLEPSPPKYAHLTRFFMLHTVAKVLLFFFDVAASTPMQNDNMLVHLLLSVQK